MEKYKNINIEEELIRLVNFKKLNIKSNMKNHQTIYLLILNEGNKL